MKNYITISGYSAYDASITALMVNKVVYTEILDEMLGEVLS